MTTSRSIFAFVLPIQSCTCRVGLYAETSWGIHEVAGEDLHIDSRLVLVLYSAGNETEEPRAAGINKAVSPAHVYSSYCDVIVSKYSQPHHLVLCTTV